ncbi:MAG TPA: endonuclease/exonuclease/phosphatase family protein [Pyrinomonadaceae bacterium]|nr:endonuclease/exonuclease/phosphatase family protein [Pyrinomonadaceae bacterium]
MLKTPTRSVDARTRRATPQRACAHILALSLALILLAALPLGSASTIGSASDKSAPVSILREGDKGEGAHLLETGAAAKPATPPADEPTEFKVVSYNIRYRAGEELKELARLLREDAEIGKASVIGLQEVDRNRKRTGRVNTARLLASELGMHYAWAAPPPPAEKQGKKQKKEREEETGVALLSPYPLVDVERVVLPHEGPGGRRRAAIGATVLTGSRRVRVYSVHAETRLKSERKLEQLSSVLDALARHTGLDGAVVLGDFNTWKGGEVDRADELFRKAGFETSIPKNKSTWKDYWILELKLDWIWLRGLKPTTGGITRRIKLSDHWPLWTTATFAEKK